VFPGELRPDELRDRTGIRIPEGDVYDTVGGYVMSVLERIPVVGDVLEIEDGTIEVQRMDGRRVDRVKFVPTPLPAGAADALSGREGGERR
jgi:CBS domain containing-hemolysin-like protein